jgi:hypothetical protein
VAQVVENLPSKCQVLSSNSSTGKEERKEGRKAGRKEGRKEIKTFHMKTQIKICGKSKSSTKRKLYSNNVYVNEAEIFQINSLTMHLKNLEKQE